MAKNKTSIDETMVKEAEVVNDKTNTKKEKIIVEPAIINDKSESKFLLGMIFVLIGVTLILAKLNFFKGLDINFYNLVRLWPLIFVVIGLSLLKTKNRMVNLFIDIACILIILVGLLASTTFFNRYEHRKIRKADSNTQYFYEQACLDTPITEVKIRTSGDLNLSSTEMKDVIKHSDNLQIEQLCQNGAHSLKYTNSDYDKHTFRFTLPDSFITLNQTKKYDLDLKNDLSNAQLDLSKVNITKLKLDFDMASAHINLPDNITTTVPVDIKSEMSAITIKLPNNAGARMHYNKDMSNLKFNLDTVTLNESETKTKNYDTATLKYDITVDSDMSTINFTR